VKHPSLLSHNINNTIKKICKVITSSPRTLAPSSGAVITTLLFLSDLQMGPVC